MLSNGSSAFKMNGVLLALCFVSLAAAYLDYRNFQLAVITLDCNASWQKLLDLHHRNSDGLIFVNDLQQDKREVLAIVNKDVKRTLGVNMKGFGINMKILDVNIDNMVKMTLPVTAEDSGKREERAAYNYSQYEPYYKISKELKRIANLFKRHVNLIRFGKSSEGRDMLGLKISHEDSSKRIVFIQCGIHAREWISHATCMFLIKELLALCQKIDNRASTRLVKLYDWVLLPVFNVDGYVYSQEKDRFWRKSRSKTENPNCKGVDLNRNWPFSFNVSGWHSSSYPCSSVYRGVGPSSEIEVKNVLKYLNTIKGSLAAFFDFHSFGQNLLYPWAFTHKRAPDDAEFATIAKEISEAIKDVHGQKYTTGTPSNLMYPVGGSSMDYVYGTLGIKFCFTMELRAESNVINFLLPPDQIRPQGEEVLAGILAAAQNIKF